MFSLQIVDTDAFIEMPPTSQLLYFHLAMRADDEGFVSSPKKIMKMIGSSDDDLKILVAKKFVIGFASGICVIKHWLIHNTIRLDRFGGTAYTEEKASLLIKDNKAYSLIGSHEPELLATTRQPDGNHLVPQYKISKHKISKLSSATEGEEASTVSEPNGEVNPAQVAFDAFWDVYPEKKSKIKARASWSKIDSALYQTIIDDVIKRKASDRMWLDKFIPHPTTYLNEQRWNDDITPPRTNNFSNKGPVAEAGKYDNVNAKKI